MGILLQLLIVAGYVPVNGQNIDFLHNKSVMERLPAASIAPDRMVPLGNLAVSTPGIQGDVYLTKDYRNSTFWLYEADAPTKTYPAKLDLQRNEFDLHQGKGQGVRALPGTRVKHLMWTDSITNTPQYFVNGQEFKNEEGAPYLGFFQILAEGGISLLKLTTVKFKPADQNPTHNTGIKDNRFMKNTELYYAQGQKAMELPNRKGILKLMESHKEEVDKFIKVNQINLSVERHLIALFDYYNSLTAVK